MFSIPCMMTEASAPFGFCCCPATCPSAAAAAKDWLIEQMPQMRGVMVNASIGSLPSIIASNPRNMGALQ